MGAGGRNVGGFFSLRSFYGAGRIWGIIAHPPGKTPCVITTVSWRIYGAAELMTIYNNRRCTRFYRDTILDLRGDN